jgi:hypothetical protein
MLRSASTLTREAIGEAHALAGRLYRLGQRAVDAVPHPDGVLEGLDVDIGGPLADALGDDPVDDLERPVRTLVDRRTGDTRLLKSAESSIRPKAAIAASALARAS